MYKKLTYDELCNINNNFFNNLQNLYKKYKYNYLKEFLKNIHKEGDKIYFFERGQAIFRIIKDKNFCFIDEREKTEVILNDEELNNLHNLLKDEKKISNIKSENKTILEMLIDEFKDGVFTGMLDKPYIVFDIETLGNISNLKSLKFMLAYSLSSDDGHGSNLKFKMISDANLKKFVDFLIGFDGYIVGYNNIYFDNQVVCYNVGYGKDEIEQLRKKSLDIFLFLRNLTGRRFGLDLVSSSLINLKKTLSSGLEGEELFKKYVATGDQKLLKKVQAYCRNDVKMTLGVLLYLLKNKQIYIDGKTYDYSIDDIIKFGKKSKNGQKNGSEPAAENTIFGI